MIISFPIRANNMLRNSYASSRWTSGTRGSPCSCCTTSLAASSSVPTGRPFLPTPEWCLRGNIAASECSQNIVQRKSCWLVDWNLLSHVDITTEQELINLSPRVSILHARKNTWLRFSPTCPLPMPQLTINHSSYACTINASAVSMYLW